jgi:hypothetical protein
VEHKISAWNADMERLWNMKPAASYKLQAVSKYGIQPMRRRINPEPEPEPKL